MTIANAGNRTVRRAGAAGVAIGLALVAFVAGRAAATDVTTCGQTVVDRDIGVLQVDLDCPDSAAAVFLGDRATLAVGGHTITGGGVQCAEKCVVLGPGTIQQVVGNGNLPAIYAQSPRGRLAVQDLMVTNNAFGIISNARQTTLTNVTASNNAETGIWVFGLVRGDHITADDNGATGVRSENRSVRLSNLTTTGNGQAGLISNGKGTRLVDSTLTGNAFPPFPGDPTMLDLFSVRKPRLVNTTCDHSLGPDDQPWGVCAGD